MIGLGRKNQEGILRDANNDIITGIEEKLKRWKNYVEERFNDDRSESPTEVDDDREKGPTITNSEVIHAIKIQKNRKATGSNKVHAEVLKIIANQEGKGLELIIDLFNTIYSAGKISSKWLKSTFVATPKKPNSSQCDCYRMISLMPHFLKVFLRIIHTRIYKKCEEHISDTQFGF